MDYHKLLNDFPELVKNDGAFIKIVDDPSVIETWKRNRQAKLTEQERPLEWADIGVILDDPFNIILRDLVRFPNGSLGGYTRSIATATLNGGRGVVVLPDYQGKLLLLHVYRHPTRQWHYEFPRGYGEPNIPPIENAHKEIVEETGGEVSELVSLGDFYNNTGYESAYVALFYARLSSVGAPNAEEGIESFVWLTVPELEQWIGTGKINDSFTIGAYTRAKLKGLI
jgi:ADP-ribose pyrophosphatase